MVKRLKAVEMGRTGPRARGLSGRGVGGAQMLAAVEAVTLMSQWQLALFNAWSHGGWIRGNAAIHGLASYVTCTYVKYILPHYGHPLNPVIP